MEQRLLQDLMQHPERLDAQSLSQLRELLEKYPYFQTARLLYLKNLYVLGDPSFEKELRQSALYVADLSVLFYNIEGGQFLIERHEQTALQQTASTDRTLDLIDRFLSEMSGEQPTELPELRPESAMDYTSILARDCKPAVTAEPEEETDELYLTETLAKVYIKQKRYEKALEIIQGIYLKNPEKNAYFADQIRFLEKLIINAKTK